MFVYRILGAVAWACESMSRTSTNLIPGDVIIGVLCGTGMWIGWPETLNALTLGSPGSVGNPLAVIALELLSCFGLGLIAYMRFSHFVVFKKGTTLKSLKMSKPIPEGTELKTWVSGFFESSTKQRRYFNSVPSVLTTQNYQGWTAKATIDTSRSFYGTTYNKAIGVWDLPIDLDCCSVVEEGTIYFGSKMHQAIRLIDSNASKIIGFASLEERQAFCRVNSLY
jgi:hypothetical protein